jgi:hypothetical protein
MLAMKLSLGQQTYPQKIEEIGENIRFNGFNCQKFAFLNKKYTVVFSLGQRTYPQNFMKVKKCD